MAKNKEDKLYEAMQNAYVPFTQRLRAKGYGDTLDRGQKLVDAFGRDDISSKALKERVAKWDGYNPNPEKPSKTVSDAEALPLAEDFAVPSTDGKTPQTVNNYTTIVNEDPASRYNSAYQDQADAAMYEIPYAPAVPVDSSYSSRVGAMGDNFRSATVPTEQLPQYVESGLGLAGDAALGLTRNINIQPKQYAPVEGGSAYNNTIGNMSRNFEGNTSDVGNLASEYSRGLLDLISKLKWNPKDIYKGKGFPVG